MSSESFDIVLGSPFMLESLKLEGTRDLFCVGATFPGRSLYSLPTISVRHSDLSCSVGGLPPYRENGPVVSNVNSNYLHSLRWMIL
jgi:hypothetical protein